MKTKVLLADDHQIVLDGLGTLLSKQPTLEVVAAAHTGHEAVALADQHHPHVVMMDIHMPDLNGIEATRQILVRQPQVKVIGLSMYSDPRMVGQILKAGAAGYLLKECAFEEMMVAIDTVMNGQLYLSPKMAQTVVSEYLRGLTRHPSSVFSTLTEREREVLQLLAEGKTTKQIAAQLYLSAKTVETHRQQLMDKLEIHSVAELTKFAIREGLTTLEF